MIIDDIGTTTPEEHLQGLQEELKELAVLPIEELDDLKLAHMDLELEHIARQLGKSISYYTLKALICSLRGLWDDSAFFAMQGGLLGLAIGTVNEGSNEEPLDKKPLKGAYQPFMSLALSLSRKNLDMALGSALLALHIADEEEKATPAMIINDLSRKLVERNKAPEDEAPEDRIEIVFEPDASEDGESNEGSEPQDG